MKRERNVLSERDRLLLQRRFRTKEPQNYPGLSERLEKGAVPVRILHDYDETPLGGRKAGHKPRIRCCFNHLHWHGYVTEFEDGRIGLLGEDCARRDFGVDVIDAIESDYNAERDRQFEIQRLLAIRQVLPAALSELRDLAVRGFDIVWQTFTRRYGKASQMLARGVRSSQGRVIAYRKERNEKAEEADARRANKDLFRDWDNGRMPQSGVGSRQKCAVISIAALASIRTCPSTWVRATAGAYSSLQSAQHRRGWLSRHLTS